MIALRPQTYTDGKRQMSLLSIELSRERIRDLEAEAKRRAGIRALHRARKDAKARAVRLRHIPTSPSL